MNVKICGHCTNWKCDEPLYLKGHCIINRMDRSHETIIEECPYYYDNTIDTVIPNEWQTEIVEIRKYYAKCPYCEFSFEMDNHRELPYFCGACGRRLRGKEE